MRYACLLIPRFPLAARIRVEPALARAAAVVLDGPANAPRVAEPTDAAAAAGVRRGHSLVQARAFLPELSVRPRDLLAERSASQALREAADAFSPRVALDGPGAAFLDVSREPDERRLLEALLGRARGAGLDGARAGAADSRAAARVAAESSTGAPIVVAPGRAAAFLSGLPLARLKPSADLRERLERWGVRSAGELARLPPGEVAARLGAEGLALHREARGIDARSFVPEPHPPRFFEGVSVEWPVAELEPFALLARDVLERLAARLADRGVAARRLELALELDPQGRETRVLALAAPTRDVKAWLELLRLELGRRPPRAPVVGLSALAAPEELRSVQLTLFGPPAPSPDRVATTLARLSSWLGPDRVGAPEAADAHRPEAYGVAEYAIGEHAPAAAAAPAVRHIALRAIRPRAPLSVRADADGRPRSLAAGSGAAAEIRGGVRVASGPWRLEEGWWTEEAAVREYWDVELSDGGLYRVFRDPRTDEWFADGIYD